MGEINKPTEATYFVAHGPNATHVGVTEPGLVTTTGQPTLEYDTSGRGFASIVENAGLALEPLPAQGEWCEKDDVYDNAGQAVVCYQSHWRTADDPATVPALFGLPIVNGEDWRQPLGGHDAYPLGAIVMYNGQEWESTLPANVWEPGVTGWQSTAPPTEEWATGVAYSVNDEVTYQGSTYRCLQAHTSQPGWTPAAVPALWALV